MRVDANVSVRESENEELGVRTEIKNISNLRLLAKAIGECCQQDSMLLFDTVLDYEISRHMEVRQAGGVVSEETRSFDSRKG